MKTAFVTRIFVDVVLLIYVILYGFRILESVFTIQDYIVAQEPTIWIIVADKLIATFIVVIFFLGLFHLRNSIKLIVKKIIFDPLLVKQLMRSSFYLLFISLPSIIFQLIAITKRVIAGKSMPSSLNETYLIIFTLLFALFIRVTALTIKDGLAIKAENDLTI